MRKRQLLVLLGDVIDCYDRYSEYQRMADGHRLAEGAISPYLDADPKNRILLFRGNHDPDLTREHMASCTGIDPSRFEVAPMFLTVVHHMRDNERERVHHTLLHHGHLFESYSVRRLKKEFAAKYPDTVIDWRAANLPDHIRRSIFGLLQDDGMHRSFEMQDRFYQTWLDAPMDFLRHLPGGETALRHIERGVNGALNFNGLLTRILNLLHRKAPALGFRDVAETFGWTLSHRAILLARLLGTDAVVSGHDHVAQLDASHDKIVYLNAGSPRQIGQPPRFGAIRFGEDDVSFSLWRANGDSSLVSKMEAGVEGHLDVTVRR